MSLDKTKPHGLIYGAANGASFEQDGMFYDSNGVLIGDKPLRVVKPVAKAAPAPAGVTPTAVTKAPAPADAQLAAQLSS